jgi:hypothetical protein
VKIVVDLGNGAANGEWLRRSRMLATAIKPLLDATVQINRQYLRDFPQTPSLYTSGVRYRQEPKSLTRRGIEDFAIIPRILQRGFGDCDDLVPYRVSELIERHGEPARIRIIWKRTPRGKLYHIQVRRADGKVEDPSRILGMKG